MLFTPTQSDPGSPAPLSDRPGAALGTSHHPPPPPRPRLGPQSVGSRQPQYPPAARLNLKRLAAIAILLWAIVATAMASRPQNAALTSLTWLLAHQQWSIASEATWQILDSHAQDSTLFTENCDLILEVDRLWIHYSGGRYGFSAQHQIWDRMVPTGASTPEVAPEAAPSGRALRDRIQQFRRRVGWDRNHFGATPAQPPIGAFPAEAPTAQDALMIIRSFDRCLD